MECGFKPRVAERFLYLFGLFSSRFCKSFVLVQKWLLVVARLMEGILCTFTTRYNGLASYENLPISEAIVQSLDLFYLIS